MKIFRKLPGFLKWVIRRLGFFGLLFGLIGFLLGGSFGIATAGWGIPATIPFALFGYLFGDWFSRQVGVGQARKSVK